jgi:putative oxidoreductase
MFSLLRSLDALGDRIAPLAPGLLPLLARLVFAATLLVYFWASAATKLGSGVTGLLLPSDGAYAQIFPKALEAAGYDSSQLGLFHWAVALAGTWAEFILPLLLLVGLLTRPAALGMIGFILVQSLTDIAGHGADAATIGAWFDRDSAALILDQRSLWILLLCVPLILGPGWLSVDRALRGAGSA